MFNATIINSTITTTVATVATIIGRGDAGMVAGDRIQRD